MPYARAALLVVAVAAAIVLWRSGGAGDTIEPPRPATPGRSATAEAVVERAPAAPAVEEVRARPSVTRRRSAPDPAPPRAAAPSPHEAAPAFVAAPVAPVAIPAEGAEEAGEEAGEEAAEHSNPAAALVWSLDREGIKAAVGASKPAIQDCYEGWLEGRPDLGGKLLVRFVVGADPDSGEGRVKEAVLVDSSVDQPFLEGCVLNALQELRFEAPTSGDLTVSYPIRFDPEQESAGE